MLHVKFQWTAALHMLERAADVALKPPQMTSWSMSAQREPLPQGEHNKEAL